MLKGRSLIEPMDLTPAESDQILDLADKIIQNPAAYADKCKGKVLATLFYEPSTRTRLSFESAMLRLGGSVTGFSSAESSSVAKGESVADTIRTVACYADIAAMRHPKEGAPLVAAMHANIPVINAGDGGHQHPTQTLTALLTIKTLKGRLNNFTMYENIKFVLISPDELRVPEYIREEVLIKKGIDFIEVERLENVIETLDVLYMTRVQKERFFNEADYIRLKDSYIVDNKKMSKAKEDMILMHPLPRVNEIAVEVDNDPRAAYFTQAKCGMYVRMALIMKLLGVE